MELVFGDFRKNVFWWGEGMTFLIKEDVNLLRRISMVGKMNKCLAIEEVLPSYPGFRKGESPHLVRLTKQH